MFQANLLTSPKVGIIEPTILLVAVVMVPILLTLLEVYTYTYTEYTI